MVKIGDRVIILPSAEAIQVPISCTGNIAKITNICKDKVFSNRSRRYYTYEVRVEEGRNRWRLRDCDFDECMPVGKQLVFDWFKE